MHTHFEETIPTKCLAQRGRDEKSREETRSALLQSCSQKPGSREKRSDPRVTEALTYRQVSHLCGRTGNTPVVCRFQCAARYPMIRRASVALLSYFAGTPSVGDAHYLTLTTFAVECGCGIQRHLRQVFNSRVTCNPQGLYAWELNSATSFFETWKPSGTPRQRCYIYDLQTTCVPVAPRRGPRET